MRPQDYETGQPRNCSWPTMRAKRAILKSCKDDMIIAQGKRRAALGHGRKMIPSFFPSGFACRGRSKPEGKKEVGWLGTLPRRWPGLLYCCAFGAPTVRRIGGLEEITSRRRNTGKLKQRAKLGVKYIP